LWAKFRQPRRQSLFRQAIGIPHSNRLLGASDEFAARRTVLRASGKFTDAGVTDQLAQDLRKIFAPRLHHARKSQKVLRERLGKLRAAVRPQPVDPGDATAELKRQELRRFVRETSSGARLKLAMAKAVISLCAK